MGPPRLSSAHSLSPETAAGASGVFESVVARIGARPDLVVVFFTGEHRARAREIAERARDVLDPGVFVGIECAGVVEGGWEFERGPGLAAMGGSFPGGRVRASFLRHVDTHSGEGLARDTRLDEADFRLGLILADARTPRLDSLLARVDEAREGRGVIAGGVCAGVEGERAFVVDDHVGAGGVLVTIAGAARADVLVSQACVGIGPTFVVTASTGAAIQRLGGRRALDVVREQAGEEVGDAGGRAPWPLVGIALDERRERFGRDDFVVRPIVGVSEESGGITLPEPVRVGRTVRLHRLDAAAASADLAMLLDSQRLHGPPEGVFLFPSVGRGRVLFGRPHHDAGAMQRAFLPPEAAASRARAGATIDPLQRAGVALAGCVTAGVIGTGPGGRTSLHGHALAAAVVREPEAARALGRTGPSHK